jgi:hypothetical protein
MRAKLVNPLNSGPNIAREVFYDRILALSGLSRLWLETSPACLRSGYFDPGTQPRYHQ